ncbi:MAG: right-handed parallel beta-helix repeat-containing protein, partial [Myxococcaceae bacterium]
DIAVFGHEYGLLAGAGSRVDAREFLSIHAERAGVAFAQSTATITDVTVVESGTFAGLQLVNSQVRVQNFRVHGAQTAGVVVRGGSAKLEDGVVTRTTAIDDSSGDGVLVRSGEAELTSVLISDSEGAGVLSGNAAKVTLRDVIVDRAKQGGVVTDYKGSLRADSVVIRNARQAALVAVEGGRISGDAITVEGSTDDVAWAECAADSAIQITRLTSQLVPRQADCVRLTR